MLSALLPSGVLRASLPMVLVVLVVLMVELKTPFAWRIEERKTPTAQGSQTVGMRDCGHAKQWASRARGAGWIPSTG